MLNDQNLVFSNGQAVTTSMAQLESLYGPQPSPEVLLTPTPGVSPAAVAAAVRRAGIDPGSLARDPGRRLGVAAGPAPIAAHGGRGPSTSDRLGWST